MKFIAEELLGMGVVGFAYDSMMGALLAHITFGIMAILTIIGFIAIIKWFFFGRRKKETKEEKWLKTGRTD